MKKNRLRKKRTLITTSYPTVDVEKMAAELGISKKRIRWVRGVLEIIHAAHVVNAKYKISKKEISEILEDLAKIWAEKAKKKK